RRTVEVGREGWHLFGGASHRYGDATAGENVFQTHDCRQNLGRVHIECLWFEIVTCDADGGHPLFVATVEKLTYLLHSRITWIVIALGFINTNGAGCVVNQPEHAWPGGVGGGNHVEC